MKKFLVLICYGSYVFGNSATPLRSVTINSNDLPTLIDSPGNYLVNDNLTYAATDATPAITISSSNVSIDFKYKSMQQTGGVLSVTGIQIGSGLMNINIFDGIIAGFSQSGLSVSSGSSFLIFEDLTFNGIGNRCMEFIGAVGSTAFQIEVLNCTFINSCTQTTADNVLTFSNCTDFKVDNGIISANGNSAVTGPLAGVKLTNCSRYYFSNTGIGTTSASTDVRGFSLNNSSGGFFEDCRVTAGRAFAATGTSRGIHLEAGTNSSINFFNRAIVAGLIGNTVDAYLSDTGCNGTMFKDCLSAALTGVGATAVVCGYHSTNNTKVSFRNCEARGGSASTSTVTPYGVYGFKLDTVTSSALINCIADYNTAAAGTSVGIYAIQSTGCTFKENQITGNMQGFDFEGTFTLNTFVKNIAERNTNPAQYIGFPTTAVSDSIWSSSVEIITGPWTNIGIS